MYGEMTFDYSSVFEGVTLNLSVYNQELGRFLNENPSPRDQHRSYPDLVFVQASFQSSSGYKVPPITRYPHGDAIKLPTSEAEAEPIYADVLQHIEQNYIRTIMEFAEFNPKILEYQKTNQLWFRVGTLTALFIQQKNNLPPNAPEIQALFEHDKKMLAKGDMVGLVFSENDFDQAIKQKILAGG